MTIHAAIVTALVYQTAAGGRPEEDAQAAPDVVFCAMGDVPYTPEEDELLTQHVAGIPVEAEFVVHLGDIKQGVLPCVEPVYQKVAAILRGSSRPVFIVPGDNEWNDCLVPPPATAWKYWSRHFMRFDRNWQHRFRVFRQLEREENFSFVRRRVLFVGINLVGGRVHDADEWTSRQQHDIDWLDRNLRQSGPAVDCVVVLAHARLVESHNLFRTGLERLASRSQKPILYLHGDGHSWEQDRPFEAKNILRVQVDQGAKAPPVVIRVSGDSSQPFRFDRRLTDEPTLNDDE